MDSPADAIAVSLDRTGGIDLPLIADMLGMDETEARDALSGLVFTDPDTDELVHAPAYLSGNVRDKLDAARGEHAEAADRLARARHDTARKLARALRDAAHGRAHGPSHARQLQA